jgi:hypothetical protein
MQLHHNRPAVHYRALLSSQSVLVLSCLLALCKHVMRVIKVTQSHRCADRRGCVTFVTCTMRICAGANTICAYVRSSDSRPTHALLVHDACCGCAPIRVPLHRCYCNGRRKLQAEADAAAQQGEAGAAAQGSALSGLANSFVATQAAAAADNAANAANRCM